MKRKKIFLIKTNGERVPYRAEKIRETLRRTGAKPELADHVLSLVEKELVSGMTTQKLFSLIRSVLKKENRCIAHRYNLRAGLLKLGPAGFEFEKYVAALLNAYRYAARLPEEDVNGLCVNHEIDVIAVRDGKTAMIEVKFRNKYEDVVKLKDTLATWARFLDLADGAAAGTCENFDEVWIVTNGRFSDRSRQFGVCKGIRLIGWSSDDKSFARLVDHASFYPVTVIDDLRQWEIERLSAKNLLLCRDIAAFEPSALAKKTGLPAARAKKIVNACKEIVSLDSERAPEF